MLAHSIPRDLFASESDLHKALGMDIDLSPSQLVTHPAQARPSDFQSISTAHNQNNIGSLQASPLQRKLLIRTLAPLDLGNSAFSMQGALQPVPHLGNVSTVPGLSLDSSVIPHNAHFLPSTGVGMNATVNTDGNTSSPRSSSSASFENQTQMTSFSRRNDCGGSRKGSPKSAPADITSFGRLNQAARQRTAQACEKCRDRKTKCSGTKPTCKRCADRGLQCVWAPDTRVRGPARQQRSSRLESGDNSGEPLSVLPVPFTDTSSGESSPSVHGHDYPSSAPAFQTTFPAISLPSHLIMRDQQKRQSWHEGAFFTGGVARGWNAHNIMGEPIRPLTAVDDCWFSVENAKTMPVKRDRGDTIRPRERRNSVSVAHLARARSRDEEQFVPTNQVPAFFDLPGGFSSVPHSAGERSNDLFTQPFGLHSTFSSGTSESEPSLSATPSHQSSSVDSQLHQLLPSYDVASKLSDEMAKLLNFPGAPGVQANQASLVDSLQGVELGKTADQLLPFTIPENANDAADEVFAQYFDTDAFGRMQK